MRLPVLSGEELVKLLRKVGYEVVRQKGSHLRLKNAHDSSRNPLTVPLHDEIRPGLLRKILRDANLTMDELQALIEK